MDSVDRLHAKGQMVRLADVFFVGPVMIYGGLKLMKTERAVGNILAALGVLTIVYNGYNWINMNGIENGHVNADDLVKEE